MKLRTRAFAAITVVLLAGCGASDVRGPASAVRDSAGVRIVESAEPLWREGEGWRLSDSPVVEIRGDGEVTDEMPLDPASVFRRGDDIVVADGLFVGHHRLLVYDADGAYVRSMGRDGEGPCEFGQLWWAQPYRGDSIVAYDYADHDVSIFAPDGTCGRMASLPIWQPPIAPGTYGFSADADGAFDDGSFLAQPGGYLDVSTGPGPVWYRHAFLRVSPEGAAYDSLGLFEIIQQDWDGKTGHSYPFGAFADQTVTSNGFYFGRGDVFEIRRHASDGTLELIVRRAREPERVTDAERDEYIAQYVERIRSASFEHGGDEAAERARLNMEGRNFAPTKPAFSDILADDDGNLWVQEYRTYLATDAAGALPPVTWSVFDPQGAWLGDVEMPGRFKPLTIANGEVLGTWTEETGIAHVQVYTLLRPAG